MTAEATAVPADAPPEPSGWSPLRHAAFRRLWTAQFVSNVGSWMQTIAAQWVMTSLTTSALLLSAISAAGSIPVLLLAIPAGALGDLLDRRRLILASQVLMLLAAALLAVLAAASALTPALLLALLFVIGIGGAASAPTWQTLTPELVPPQDRPQAIALGSVNQNLARAVGPAIGGALLAATSAALVFGVNAVSFLAVVGAVAVTAVPIRTLKMPREHAFAASTSTCPIRPRRSVASRAPASAVSSGPRGWSPTSSCSRSICRLPARAEGRQAGQSASQRSMSPASSGWW
jgi:MFS family permease